MGKVVCVVVGGSDIKYPNVDYETNCKYVYRVFDSKEKADKYIQERMTEMYDGMKRRNARVSSVHFSSTYPVSGLYAYIDEYRDDRTIRHYYEWLYQLVE